MKIPAVISMYQSSRFGWEAGVCNFFPDGSGIVGFVEHFEKKMKKCLLIISQPLNTQFEVYIKLVLQEKRMLTFVTCNTELNLPLRKTLKFPQCSMICPSNTFMNQLEAL